MANMSGMTIDEDQGIGPTRQTVSKRTVLAAKADVLARLQAAEELRPALRSIGIGWDAQGARCVRVGLAPEAMDVARVILPKHVGGVTIELHEAGPIRAQSPRY